MKVEQVIEEAEAQLTHLRDETPSLTYTSVNLQLAILRELVMLREEYNKYSEHE